MRTLDLDWVDVKTVLSSEDPRPEGIPSKLDSREAAVVLTYAGVEDPIEELKRSPRHSVDPLCVALVEIHRKVAGKVSDWRPLACPDVRAASEFTREPVALAKAEFLKDRAGGKSVLDMCAGIGADALALSRFYGEVTAVERDPVRSRAVSINADMHSEGRVDVVEGDALSIDISPYDAVHADPSRGRSKDPERTEPPVPDILDSIEDAPYLVEVPHAVDVREGMAVFSHSGGVKAVCVTNLTEGVVATIVDSGFEIEGLPRCPRGGVRNVEEIGWILEQDPAVRKSRLSWMLARELGVRPTVSEGVETVMWAPQGEDVPRTHPALIRVVKAWEEGKGPPFVVSVGVKIGRDRVRTLRKKYSSYDVVYVTPVGVVPGRLVGGRG